MTLVLGGFRNVQVAPIYRLPDPPSASREPKGSLEKGLRSSSGEGQRSGDFDSGVLDLLRIPLHRGTRIARRTKRHLGDRSGLLSHCGAPQPGLSLEQSDQVVTVQAGTVHRPDDGGQEDAGRYRLQVVGEEMTFRLDPTIGELPAGDFVGQLLRCLEALVTLPRPEPDRVVGVIEHLFDSLPAPPDRFHEDRGRSRASHTTIERGPIPLAVPPPTGRRENEATPMGGGGDETP